MTDALTSRPTTTDHLLDRYRDRCLATAYVPLPSAIDGAQDRMDLQLSHARDAVAAVADEDAADRLVATIRAAGHDVGASVVAVVDEQRVWLWPSSAELDRVDVMAGPLPALGRLLAQRQAWIPHALVRVDRKGADLTIADRRSHEVDLTVEGAHSHLTKSNPGGWSQRRFQQRAEEHWQDNMQEVAEVLTREVRDGGIDLVLVAGGPQIVSILRDALPADVVADVVDLDAGGRAEDGSAAHVDDLADQAVRREAARRRAAAQQQVVEAVDAGRGVTGREAVLRALFEGAVDTLAVHLDATRGIDGFLGEDPRQVAADSGTLHALDLPATRVPLVDAALSGAAASGAAVLMQVDSVASLEDGLAASLRR